MTCVLYTVESKSDVQNVQNVKLCLSDAKNVCVRACACMSVCVCEYPTVSIMPYVITCDYYILICFPTILSYVSLKFTCMHVTHSSD